MKTFQKIILASAISAAPFASQAMEALDDSVLGNTTGQAGVTIEIDIAGSGISVGEIEYTDTAGFEADGTTPDGDGGSVKLQNLVINNVNGLTQTIDVKSSGDLVIGTTALAGVTVDLGGVNALGQSKSAVLLQGTTATDQAELVNNLNLDIDLGESTVTIHNMSATATGQLSDLNVVGANASYTPALAISMDTSFQITDLDVGLFGYTADQATVVAGQLAGGVALSDPDSVGKVNGAIANYNTATGATVATVVAGDTLTTEQQGAVAAAAAGGSAVKITDLQFYGGTSDAKTAVTMDQTIWAQGGSSEFGGGVYIQIGEIKGTLDIGAIEIGGSSIGQVKVSDINLAGMTQRIYGH